VKWDYLRVAMHGWLQHGPEWAEVIGDVTYSGVWEKQRGERPDFAVIGAGIPWALAVHSTSGDGYEHDDR